MNLSSRPFKSRKTLFLTKEFKKVLKKKNEIKPWETLIVSDNLNWKNFQKLIIILYDLNGVKPVISISRNYPFKDNFTHVLGICKSS